MLFETKNMLQPVDNNLVQSLIFVDKNKFFNITSAFCLNNMLVYMVNKF